MSYLVLARKWRPQTFDDVVGQGAVVTTLKKAVENGRIAHAYLFSGPRGVGKTTMARIMAKALNCQQGPTITPCNECLSCREITQSCSLDVQEIDGASNRKIEQIRDLQETLRYASHRDRFKIFIIDEVHMLTEYAFNALLKTLEEPPAGVHFIFATTEYRKIPITILSRCQQYDFSRVGNRQLVDHLGRIAAAEQVEIGASSLHLIAEAAEGCIRDALSILDRVISFCGGQVDTEAVRMLLGGVHRQLLEKIVEAIARKDSAATLKALQDVIERGYELRRFLVDLAQIFRNLLVLHSAPQENLFESGDDEREWLSQQVDSFSDVDLIRFSGVLFETENILRFTAHPRYVVEAQLIRMIHMLHLPDFQNWIGKPTVGVTGDDSVPATAAKALPETNAGKPAAPETPQASREEPQPTAIQAKSLGQLVSHMTAVDPGIGQWLRGADSFEYEEGVLRFHFPEEKKTMAALHAPDQLSNQKPLIEALSQCLGNEVEKIDVAICQFAKPLVAESLDQQGQPAIDSLESEARGNPHIKLIEEKFQAVIERIVPISS